MDPSGELIGLVAVILGVGTPVFIIGFMLIYHYRKRQLLHRERIEAIKMGKPVPFEIEPIKHKRTGPLWGFIFTSFGLVLFIAQVVRLVSEGYGRRFEFMEDLGGLAVLSIGVAMLLYHKMYGVADQTRQESLLDEQKKQSQAYLDAFTKGSLPEGPASPSTQS